MSESKPGLLKRIFSFGFGRKKGAPAEEEETATEQPVGDPHEADTSTSAKDAGTKPTAKDAAEPPKSKKKDAPEQAKAKPPAKKAPTPAKRQPAPAKDKPAPPAEKKKPAKAKAKEPVTKKAAKPAPKSEPSPAKKKAEPAATKSVPVETKPDPEMDPAPPPTPQPELPARQTATPATPPSAPPRGGKVRLFEEKPEAAAEAEPPEEARRKGWFARMRKGLSRSADALSENIASVFTKTRLDDDTLQDLEDILIQADLGTQTAVAITDALAAERYGKDVGDEEVRSVMAAEIAKVLAPVALPLELDLEHRPHVILVVGVNGSGKTTTIGKLSEKLRTAGLSTLLVAGDTFRAAAIEQLKIWGERTGTPVASREIGADAAGLAFDAFTQAREEGHDVMLMDTAGRLQNKAELMAELEKIIRVLKKQDETAPHTVLLTLDATTGQNALNQVEIFAKTAGVDGLVMTKLDGTARGGILVSIAAKHQMPVYFIGVGEGVDDLEPFEADEFARSIAGLSDTQKNKEAG